MLYEIKPQRQSPYYAVYRGSRSIFRSANNLQGVENTLDNVYIMDANGNKIKVEKKKQKNADADLFGICILAHNKLSLFN